jgi:large repetitive protein
MQRKSLLIKLVFFIGIVSMMFSEKAFAQVPTCGSNVPFYRVDLTGQPNGTWISPNHVREGQCCSVTFPDVCTSLEIILDPRTAAINFKIASGAIPPGSMFYQINCGTPVAVGQPICLSGAGPHRLTFCKPGNNTNTYAIEAIPEPIFPDDKITRKGCSIPIPILGLDANTIQITSVFPGNIGEYNTLLSCTTNCVTPIFTAPTTGTLPDYIDYRICGFPTADECGYIVTVCDTVRVSIKDLLGGSVTPNPASFCEGGSVTLSAQGTGGDGNFTYKWRNSSNVLVGSSQTYTATVQDNYTIEIGDGLSTGTCPNIFIGVPVEMGKEPIVNAGEDKTVCATSPSTILNGSILYAAYGKWTGGNGTYFPNDSTLNARYTPTLQEIQNGIVTLTLTSKGAGGGCSNSSDQVKISFSDTVKIVMPDQSLLCYGNNINLVPSISGGTLPYAYSWNTGSTASSIVVTEGNYCLTVTDNIGCKATICANITTPSPLALTLSSTDVTTNGGNDGTATVVATGGAGDYTYLWSNGQSTTTINNLIYGIYTVTVKDKNGCIITGSVLVNEPRCLNLEVIATSTNINCFGQNNGTASATVSGGTTPYTYLWSNGATTASISNLAPGTYTITVTDSFKCKDVASVAIVSPTPLTNSMTRTDIPIIGGATGTATANPFGGTPGYTYLWSTGATTQTITGLTAGNYNVTITDANGCVLEDVVKVNEPPCDELSVSVVKSDIKCNGNTNGTATAIVSNGLPPYRITWSNGMTGQTVTGLTAGNYAVFVTDSLECTQFFFFRIEEPAQLSVAIAPTNVRCNGQNNGSVEVTTIGGVFPYYYSWSNGQTGEDLAGLALGTYNLTVTDANACSTSVSATITEPDKIIVTHQVTNNLCFGGNQGAIDVTFTGGVMPIRYLWSNGATSQDLTNLTSGSYTLNVIDANNCTLENGVQIGIQEPSQLTAAIINQQNVLCKSDATGSATVQGGGGTETYNYEWNTNPIQTTATATGLTAGVYTVKVFDNNGCTIPASVSVTITEPANALALTTTRTNVLCKGEATGTATANPTGGTQQYTYSWNTNPVQTTKTATGLAAGTYTVTVFDANGCDKPVIANVTITEPAQKLDVNILSKVNVLCKSDATGSATSVASGGSGSYSYSWNTNPVQTGATASNLSAGNYIVTVFDNNGCNIPDTAHVTITEPAIALGVSVTAQTNVNCKGDATGSATATAVGGSGNYNYSWNTNPIKTTAIATDLRAGTYTVTVTDKNGCTKPVTATVTINEPTNALASTISSPTTNGFNIACNGGSTGSINLTPSGGTSPYAFSWTGPNGFTASTEDLTGLKAGAYSVLITDNKGCTLTRNINLSQPSLIVINSSVNPTLCNGSNTGSVTLAVSGGVSPYTYSWTGPSGFTASTKDISSLEAGSYTVTVTDANACTRQLTVQITQPGTLTLTGTAVTYNGGVNVSCFGFSNGSINITAGGGTPSYTYSWTGPNNYSSSNEDISNLSAGIYEVVVTDDNGCSINRIFDLKQPNALDATFELSTFVGGNNVSCFGANDGSVDMTVTGGTPTYTYLWSNSANTQDISSLLANTYSVQITDINGCVLNKSVTLTQPQQLTTTISATTYAGGFNIKCFNGTDGMIQLGVNGGVPSYSYLWNTGYAGQNPSNVPFGSYSVTVTDANGCSATNNISLTQPTQLQASATVSQYAGNNNISCFGRNDGNIDVSVSGGTTNYSYMWNNGITTQDLSNIAAGTYSLTITDANACTTSISRTLVQPAELTASHTTSQFNGGVQVSCNGSTDGSINLTVNGGTVNYTIEWYRNGNLVTSTEDLNNIGAGQYVALISDANGCQTTQIATLTQPAPLNVIPNSPTYAGGYNISCFGLSNGSVNLSTTGGTTAYGYAWTGPSFSSTQANIANLVAGTYNIVVTDANSCSANASITLTQPQILATTLSSPEYVGGVNISCFGLSNGSINHQTTGGTTAYNYVWTGPNNFYSNSTFVSSLREGEYFVTITDANQCQVRDSITLVQPEAIVLSLTTSNYNGFQISCNGLSDGSVDLSVSGGITDYTYLWTLVGTNIKFFTEDLSNIAIGTYSVDVTDANGCLATINTTIAQPTALSLSGIVSDYNTYGVSCFNSTDGSINVTAGGGVPTYTYQWTKGEFTSTDEDLTNIGAGGYLLNVTDLNGCGISKSFRLAEPLPLVITGTNSDYNGFGVSCFESTNGFIDVNVFGSVPTYTFSWNNGASTEDLFNIGAGSYELIVTDLNGCKDTLDRVITQPKSLIVNAFANFYFGDFNISCNGLSDGSIGSMASGGVPGYGFAWSNGENTAYIDSLAAGSYSLVVTDANNCIIRTNVDLREPEKLIGNLTLSIFNGGYNIACYGNNDGFVNTTVNGGVEEYAYQWNNGLTSANITDLEAGEYEVNITDKNGCRVDLTTVLTQPDSLYLTTTTQVATCAGANGGVDLTVTGGTRAYSYEWNNGSNTQDLVNVTRGEYTVVVTDGNGCTKSTSAIVDLISSMMLNSVVNDVLCYGDTNGSISVNVQQGTAPYVYNWSNGASSAIVTNLQAGEYSLVVTDANGCESSQVFTIVQAEKLTLEIFSPEVIPGFNISQYKGNDGSIDLTVNGGTTPFIYNWSSGQNVEDISNLTAGTYIVLVSDANGCTEKAQITLKAPLKLEIPTGYTPNNDGSNDLFVVRGIEAFPNNKILIFNRWGNEVYSKSGYMNDWAGQNNKGETLPEGTYFVILSIDNGEIELKGYVDLRR